jgi:acyl-CoA synthetase (AMP-forming)/AMP-acid ligase II
MQPDTASIVDILSARARVVPDSLAYGFLASGEQEEARLSWGDVDRDMRRIAAAISRHVPRGARVLLLFPPGLAFVPAFFGCLAAGAIALPAYAPCGRRRDRAIARLRGMIGDAGVSLVVAPESVRARASVLQAAIPELRDIPWLSSDEAAAMPAPETRGPRSPDAADVALLQYTSGSTTTPRGVVVTHGNLLHNLARGARLGGCDAESVGVSWLPINHDMGLIGGVLQPAFSGFPMWLMAPAAFLQRPVRWLQAISRFGGTHSAAPNFAYELCARRATDSDRRSLDLGCWRVAYNAAEPVRTSTLHAFQRAFGDCGFRWEALRPAYGLAESTLLVSSLASEDGPLTLEIDRRHAGQNRVAPITLGGESMPVVACGEIGPIDGNQRIVIVDPERRVRCGPDDIGEIWLAGKSVAAGYWNRAEETAATFGARLRSDDDRESYLRTGDLGFVRAGHLYVTGRIKDVLIVRGQKHYPQDLEQTAEAASPLIRLGCCAAIALESANDDERIVIIAEMDDVDVSGDDAIAAVRRAVVEAHAIALGGVVLVHPRTLPRTTSGKLQRYLCRQAYAAVGLEVVAYWSAPGTPSPVDLRRAS